MSPAEIAWRTRSAARDAIDSVRLRIANPEMLARRLLQSNDRALGGGFSVLQLEGNQTRRVAHTSPHNAALIRRADDAAAGYIELFDVPRQFVGNPPDWNRDHKHGVAAPRGFSASIDYRSFAETGDCKFVWEPNRHQHLVVLARAYHLTQDVRYAQAVAQHIESWLDQNPFAHGMNWRSPLELGIRLINWVWALDLIKDADVIGNALADRIRNSVALHTWDVARKYSQGSSANNHVIGEAAGVLIAAAYFPELRDARRFRDNARRVLCEEILRQTNADGGTAEQAFGYHGFITQFFTLSGLVGRCIGIEFGPAFWERLEAMYAYANALLAGGDAPNFGDGDDGYVLDLGNNPRDFREWIGVGAALFNRPDLADETTGVSEPAWWLLGASTNSDPGPAELDDRAFEASGLYLMQAGCRSRGDAVSILFDCGPLGFGPLAAHGHADALSFTLRLNGREVFADAGTYDYFTYPEWRNYFRSTRAHNTVMIDGRDQSEILGGFQWGLRAAAHCVEWSSQENIARVAGEHDGYAHERTPVVHRRTITFDKAARKIRIDDFLMGSAGPAFEIRFHLGAGCRVHAVADRSLEVETPDGDVVELNFCQDVRLSVIEGGGPEAGGWNSRGYHRRSATPTIVLAGSMRGDDRLVTEMRVVSLTADGSSSASQTARLVSSGVEE